MREIKVLSEHVVIKSRLRQASKIRRKKLLFPAAGTGLRLENLLTVWSDCPIILLTWTRIPRMLWSLEIPVLLVFHGCTQFLVAG